jgi:glutaredoxin
VSLVLVTRRDCRICANALSLIRELGYEPDLADVDADPGLLDLYDWRVPVVLLHDRVIAEGRITRVDLEKALKPA